MLRAITYTLVVSIFVVLTITATFLAFVTFTTEKIDENIKLATYSNQDKELNAKETLTITTFNIGYGGLSRDQDYFVEGDDRGPTKKKTLKALEGITNFLKDVESDIILLQEVDTRAMRSFDIDQYSYLKESLVDYGSVFAYNYKTAWTIDPATRPHGHIESGIATFSRLKLMESYRKQLPDDEKWPKRLFEMDRCIIKSKIPVKGNKNLYILNIHLSAHDEDNDKRLAELRYIQEKIKNIMAEDNYIIVGGDWNQILSTADLEDLPLEQWPKWVVQIPDDFLKGGFKWAVDHDTPTVRVGDEYYNTIVDGFLVSSNIEVLSIEGHDLNFEKSDHNPVTVKISLH
ncbi:endonuclease/exonuclease/phosphatase family protein [Proteinivorax hydrogeniformans]|uniref:Endonuclease/exonuclease/phosphatase family protein n=1 Tax=Proteinivorax hydrogeniformans TaxID=1826727 RepID=A0AAU8HVR0_9FIRM